MAPLVEGDRLVRMKGWYSPPGPAQQVPWLAFVSAADSDSYSGSVKGITRNVWTISRVHDSSLGCCLHDPSGKGGA